jgi:hypothetical protein
MITGTSRDARASATPTSGSTRVVRLVEGAYAGCALEPAPANQLLDRGWPVRLLRLPGGVSP